MTEIKPLGGRVFTIPFMVCLFLVIVALVCLVYRFIYGLGAVTNMNDGFPWGIWIAYDVVVGTAFACGGYAIAMLVYLFNKGEYHPLLRPALLTSMFGYTLAGISVMFDIGRYWQAYNLLFFWKTNFNSVLLEVALCIGAYVMVLWVEFTPAFLEKWKFKNLEKKLNRLIFVFIALGILLPTMHQSSLGTMMLAAGYKLSPLWRTGFLPLLFLISALFMGYAVVVFETSVSTLIFSLPRETRILSKISKIIPWFIALFLIIRFEDINIRGFMPLAFSGDFRSTMFLIESLLIFLTFLILIYPNNRKSPRLLFISSILLLLGGALYRFNTYLIGFDPGTGWIYFPAVPELLVTYGIIAFEVLAYLLFVKKFPVLSIHEKS
jgi:Ni/Fe-hydrogenase subunit HybB-like protein